MAVHISVMSLSSPLDSLLVGVVAFLFVMMDGGAEHEDNNLAE